MLCTGAITKWLNTKDSKYAEQDPPPQHKSAPTMVSTIPRKILKYNKLV